MRRNFIEVVLSILVIISFVVAIIILLWMIFGRTPSLLDFLVAMVVGLGFHAIRIEFLLGNSAGKFEMFEKHVRDSFGKVKEDMRDNFDKVREDIRELKEIVRGKK